MFEVLLDPLARIRELCPAEKFREMGLPGYAVPKMHSGLFEGVNFQRYESVARCWMESALLFHYRDLPLPVGSSVILFTWVMPDGLGDWSCQHTAAVILKKAMPDLRIELVTLVKKKEKRFLSHPDFPCHLLSYKNKDPAEFSGTLLKKMASASLILQLPTFYPHFNALLAQVKTYSLGKMPTTAHVGEYGFLDSEWFHPESGNMCMGLHALEKGLLLHSELSSVDILQGSPFYFAYLVTKRGYAIYLHALLKYKMGKPGDIKLIVCNLLPLLEAIREENLSEYGLKEIVIRDGQNETSVAFGEAGKRVLIECRQNLSSLEVQKLFLSAENFVGCRGDRSFSEVVSLERLFFYDPPVHSLPFLHDLYDLANYYFLAYPSLLSYLKCFLDVKSAPKLVGDLIAEFLNDPSLFCGMKKLLSLLKSDYLFNPTLVNLVKSKIYHHYYPTLKENEETLFKEFLKGAHSLESLILPKERL